MTKAKKAISLIVSVVMLLGVLAVGVFANDNTGVAENGTIALSFDKASYSAGETVKVTVKLTTDYYAATVSVPVQYDSSAVKFVSGTTASTLFGAGDATKTVVNDAAAGGKTYVYVGVLPQAAGGAVAQKANGVVLSTLTFTASKAISDTAAAFGVLNDQKTMTNLGGKLYVGSYKTSDVASTAYTTGQKLTFPVMKAAVAADPELILTEEGNGAVIRTDLCTGSGDYAGCVFGIDTLNGENIEDFVTTKAGSIEVVANDQGNITTGATILLKDDSGKVVATYVFIYFGDVNGDGAVNITDSSDIEAHDQWVKTIPEDTAAYYSCDVNADAAVNITDSSDIEAHDQWVKELRSQKEIAADFNKAW